MRRSLLRRLSRLAPSALLVLTAVRCLADPRPPDAGSAGELRVALRRLQVTGTALYVGAHPDDDNTSLLAYLARHRLVRTAYLSLTRGDGGQNLLGPEAGEALGVLRTQELLASRRVDGAAQYFSRAVDYGFSKDPDEALGLWGRERVLADVVWIIRSVQPDVIITRFGTDGSGGHGHHTASAILAGDAFRAAADSSMFPEQLRWVRPWQARRLVWNIFQPTMNAAQAREAGLVTLDVGDYDPELGLGYAEIGGRARSLNRSQGAGTRERRGSTLECFRPVDGEKAVDDLFDGVTLDWSRVPGGAAVGALFHDAEQRFDPDHPGAVLPLLARAHRALAALPATPLVVAKRAELESVMRSAAGLWLEAIADGPTYAPGDTVRVALTAIQRVPARLAIQRIEVPFGARAWYATGTAAALRQDPQAPADATTRPLVPQQPLTALATLALPPDAPLTQPYWLEQRPLPGTFQVADPRLVGEPETPPALVARVTVAIEDEPVTFDVPMAYRWTDRVYGDRYRAVEVLPPVTLKLDQGVYLFPDARPREVRLTLHATHGAFEGIARLRLPSGWSAEPRAAAVSLPPAGERTVSFRVTAGAGPEADTLAAEAEAGGRRYGSSLTRIDYPHVPIQTLLLPCEAPVVHAPVRHTGDQVAYLMGPGDPEPDALRQLGCRVTLLTDEEVEGADLSRFGCIVTGVRAYNTRPRLVALQPRLLDYVKAGGRLVVQYCTPDAALDDRLGPWPFKVSRDRVAVEDAPVRLLLPGHPLLHAPNPIGPHDFDGWVQERGLSFAAPFDARYQAVLSSNDPKEPPRDGGLLYTPYGKGVFIYSGLALFRQLPAGVPGAWRLFANLVSPGR